MLRLSGSSHRIRSLILIGIAVGLSYLWGFRGAGLVVPSVFVMLALIVTIGPAVSMMLPRRLYEHEAVTDTLRRLKDHED
jgi:hypothetical protein